MNSKVGLMCAVIAFVIFTACSEKDSEIELAGINLSKTSVTLKPEETETLTVTIFPDNATNKNLIWSSSNEQVATISNGVITAVGLGNTIVTATAVSDPTLHATCNVTVSWESLNNVSGNVSGTWDKNTTVNVSGHITVPEGQTLTIEEGVQVIFSSNGVGASHVAIELIVNGKLYCKGTETNPILFSVAENERTASNKYAGLWGGIVCGTKCPEALFEHVIVEYTGGACTAETPSVIDGYYVAGGDFTPCITTNNTEGKYVVRYCTFRYTGESDALYFMGGQAIIHNNTFYAVGGTGAEAINMKAGCKVDAAYNLIFSPNTNGLKLSSSGQSAERSQALVRAYNNTIINAGWRRTSIKGGSIYAEKGVRVSVFNNLMVNCKFRAKTPKWNDPSPSNGADNRSIIDYNFYASGTQQSPFEQDKTKYLTSFMGYTAAESDYWHNGLSDGSQKVDEHSPVSASAGDASKDPKFVNFGLNAVPLERDVLDPSWNFHVQSGSPVLTGAYNTFTGEFTPYFGSAGLTVGGREYKTPAPAARFGAFGTN